MGHYRAQNGLGMAKNVVASILGLMVIVLLVRVRPDLFAQR